MKTSSIKSAIDIVNAKNGPLCQLVRQAVEVGVIVPSVVESLLSQAGYKASYRLGNVGVFCELHDQAGVLIGSGYDTDPKSSLLQAIFGAVKDEPDV